MLSHLAAVVYAFGDCEVDVGRFEVRRSGAAVHVEPKVFDVLALLVAHHDRVVSKQELLDRVWGRGSSASPR